MLKMPFKYVPSQGTTRTILQRKTINSSCHQSFRPSLMGACSMDAPPSQLKFLREVVGQGPSDDALSSAWKRSGGDLAAAVNIILDAPPPRLPRPGVSTINLDDTDGEEADKAVAGPPKGPAETSEIKMPSANQNGFLKLMKVKQEEIERPKKKPRTGPKVEAVKGPKTLRTEPKKEPHVEWAMALGSLEVVGYSTMRLDGGATFRAEDGSMGPLLRSGARLELKWQVDTKKGRPGTGLGKETGQVHFEVCGKTVGKFPSWTSKALVPLLVRKLIDAEAVVGKDPPRALDLGTNIPVLVHISLRSSALRTPGQMADLGKNQEDAGKSKAKGQKAVQKAETDREVQRTATSILLEKLQLPCPRRAVLDDVPEGTGTAVNKQNSAATGNAGNGTVEAAEEEGEDQMSAAAAAQLGRPDQLERHELPGIVLPKNTFETTLRPYQAKAVYWMWQRENPTSSLPAAFKNVDLQRADDKGTCSTSAARASEERQLHPMWDEYQLPVTATGPLPDGREPPRFLYYHRTSGALSLDFPDAALAYCRGGILADDMGLGKTVMCLALMALDSGELPTARTAAPDLRALEEADLPAKQRSLCQDDGVAGVLVVAPLSLIRQWQSEAQKHFCSSACPTMHEFHGSGRHVSLEQLRSCGIVFTTYNTLASHSDSQNSFKLIVCLHISYMGVYVSNFLYTAIIKYKSITSSSPMIHHSGLCAYARFVHSPRQLREMTRRFSNFTGEESFSMRLTR